MKERAGVATPCDSLIPRLTREQVIWAARQVRSLERRGAFWRYQAASVLRWHIRRSGWKLDRPATRLRRRGRKAVGA